MIIRYRHLWKGLLPPILAAFMILFVVQFAETATSTKTNSNAGEADGVVITRDVLFTTADFAAGSQIDAVTLQVDFEKIGGDSCAAGHQAGSPAYNGEIYMYLESPLGTQVVLIEDTLNSAGSGNGRTYIGNNYSEPVSVTFDDFAAADIGGLAPESGSFRPEQPLSAFNGEDPNGTWTLYVGDNSAPDPLCFSSMALTINASQAPVMEDQSFSVSESAAVDTEVGTVVATDNDPNEKLNFMIESSDPAADFSIESLTGVLRVANPLDFETTSVYTLQVRVTDSSGLFDTAEIIINVLNSDEAPVAADDGVFNTDEDTVLSDTAPGVLANDSDPDGPTPSVDSADTLSANGAAVVVNPDGSYSYDPTASLTLQALQDTSPTVNDEFTYTVIDSSNLTDTATVFVNVTGVNDAPVAVDDTATTTEGTPVEIFVLDNDSDIDTGDSLTVTAVGSVDASTNGTTVTFTPPDPTSPVVFTYTIEDTRSAEATGTITVTVDNAAPTLQNVSTSGPLNEGDTATLNFEIADMSTGDTYTVTVDWGDGTAPEIFNYGAAGAQSETHLYVDNDADESYTIGLTVEDSAGGVGTASVDITVNNVAPTLSNVATTPAAINEGEMITVSGDIADPGVEDTFTVQVDWGDGNTDNFSYPAGTTSFEETYTYPDDNPSGTLSDVNTVSVTVTDKDNDSDSDSSQSVTVNNVAPTLSGLTLTPGPLNEGDTATLSGSIADVGTEDTFVLTVDWGDAVETYNYNATGPFNATHTYTEDSAGGDFTVTAVLEDDDTGSDDAGTVGTIAVNNVAPQPANLTVNNVDEGGTTTFTADIGDPGTADSFNVTIDWGDGVTDTVAYPAGSTTINETHTYADDNPTGTPADDYTIDLTIEDDEGASGSASTSVTVSNVAPTVDAGADLLISIADPTATFTGIFTDAGTADTHTILWEFGDGNTATGTLTPTHTYPAVATTYLVTLTVTDDDTGTNVDTLMVEVGNTAPTAQNDTGSTDEDTVLTAAAPGVLGNDSDPESDPITIDSFEATSLNGATVSVAADGGYTYDPTAAATLQAIPAGGLLVDSFTYTIADSGGLTSTAIVEIAVSGLNDAPSAVDDDDTTLVNTPKTVAVLDNDDDIDGDTLTVTAVGTPTQGTATTDGTTVLYTPATDFTGNDVFTYTVSDGNGGLSTATVNMSVTGANTVYLPLAMNNAVIAPDLVVTAVSGRSDLIEVTIENQGSQSTDSAFWVDFYIDPDPAPTQPNQFWQDLSEQGLVWLVDVSLVPGESLTLTYSTDSGAPNLYYAAEFSLYDGQLPAGTPLYAQVDSAHVGTSYGGILETHEILGTAYNNVSAVATAD